MDRIFSNEIINYHIVSALSAHLAQNDLYSLCLVNKQFYRLVLPHLYRSVTITESELDPAVENTTYIKTTFEKSSLHNAKLFLRSIAENPLLLVQLIREINIRDDVWFKDIVNDIIEFIVMSPWNHLVSVWCDHERLIWNSHRDKTCLRCGGYNKSALLMNNNNKLKILQVSSSLEFQNLVSTGGQRCLSSLQKLVIDESSSSSFSHVYTTKGVNSVLKNLKELTLLYDPYPFVMSNSPRENQMTTIRKLSIDRTILIGSLLMMDMNNYLEMESRLIQSCPLLKQLRYRFKFGSFGLFEEFFPKFLHTITNRKGLELELDISIRGKNFNHDQVILQCYHYLDLLKLERLKLTVYNNCNKYYIDYK